MEHCPSWPRNNGCSGCCCWPCPAAALIKNSKIKFKIFLAVILTQMEQWMQVAAWLVDCSAACITRLNIYKYISVSSIYFIYMSIVGAGPGRCRKPKWSRLHCILYRCHCSVLGWQLNPTRFDFRFLSRQASSSLAAHWRPISLHLHAAVAFRTKGLLRLHSTLGSRGSACGLLCLLLSTVGGIAFRLAWLRRLTE